MEHSEIPSVDLNGRWRNGPNGWMEEKERDPTDVISYDRPLTIVDLIDDRLPEMVNLTHDDGPDW